MLLVPGDEGDFQTSNSTKIKKIFIEILVGKLRLSKKTQHY